MDGVSAGHFVRGRPRTKEVFLTDRAIRLVLSAFAIVVGVQGFVNAHAAIMTMLKVFRATHSTETAILTVIWFFIIRHPKVTNVTMVLSKGNSTRHTIVAVQKRQSNASEFWDTAISATPNIKKRQYLRFGRLLGETLSTNDFLHGEPVNGMVGFFRSLWIG